MLTDLWHAEMRVIVGLFSKYAHLRKLFDAPETTIPQRTTCFELLAHRKIIEMVDDAASDLYVRLPALSDEESTALKLSQNLVAPDAPAWVREINDVADLLPLRIHAALPEPLREEGWYKNDPARGEAIRSAAETLSTVEGIQILTARVIDEQLQRLRKRWSAAIGQNGGPKNPKHWLKGYKGLGSKVMVMSNYKDLLTDKQEMAFSLKHEYGLGPTEVASRMGIDRKTVSEHLAAADKRINHAYSRERRRDNHAKNSPE